MISRPFSVGHPFSFLSLLHPLPALVGALLIYGAFSRPAPGSLGMAELGIAGLLAAAVGVRPAVALLSGAWAGVAGAPVWGRVGGAVFVVLLWLPLLRGAALDWPLEDMVRDLIPLLYLFLPVLLVPALTRAGLAVGAGGAGIAVRMLAAALAAAGTLFALRWWGEGGWGLGAVGVRAMSDGMAYFLNSPTVLFAALWLPFLALQALCAGRGGGWLWPALALAAGAQALLALAGAVHRLAILAMITSGGFFLLHPRLGPLRRRRGRFFWGMVVLAGGLTLGLWLPGMPLAGVLAQVWVKSEMVGGNERVAEAQAVLEQISRSPAAFLLGDGWGAKVASPAVGGMRVGYTHSIVSYILLKAGLVGELLLFLWFATLVPPLSAAARGEPLLALAAFPPLGIGLFFHTSFKYLCFGLLLTLAILAGSVVTPGTGKEDRS